MDQTKIEKLRELLGSYGSCVVAYSGGVDSVFLAYVAHEVLGERAIAAIADSPSLPRAELKDALEISDRFGFPVRVVKTAEFDNPSYTSNPTNRCYFCKHELFDHLVAMAKDEEFATIVYGENASDVGDFRPGAQAATEFSVRAPLKEVGMTKTEIREWSAKFGLPTADKPQMACLSSRIPYGETVTPQKLSMVERAEAVLRGMGFLEVRVRHHESTGSHRALGGNGVSHLARIEIGTDELPHLFADGRQDAVFNELKSIGYAHVTVDLQGYRRGSLNQAVAGLAAVS